MSKPDRRRGRVKWFNDDKGFGFITPSDGTKDLFVHFKSVKGFQGRVTLQEAEEVEFDTVMSDKGPRAENVHKV